MKQSERNFWYLTVVTLLLLLSLGASALVHHDFSSLYIFPFSHSYSVFRSFSKQQDCLMLGFLDISCLKPQAGAICAYSKQNVVP